MANSSEKVWKEHKDGSKGSTRVAKKTVRNTELTRICFEYKQTWLVAKRGTGKFSVLGGVSVCKPPMHHFQDKNGFIDSKNPLFIVLWNQGSHIIGYLWIQTDHNLDHKFPHCDQPGSMLYLSWQSMISLFLFAWSTRESLLAIMVNNYHILQIFSKNSSRNKIKVSQITTIEFLLAKNVELSTTLLSIFLSTKLSTKIYEKQFKQIFIVKIQVFVYHKYIRV